MVLSKFLSTPKLIDYLEQEQREALAKARLYPLSDYGWSGEDTPDHQGIAKWGIEPPWESTFDGFLAQPLHRCSPPSRAEELTHIGDDFEAVMHMALSAIGQALVFLELSAQHPFLDYQWFWGQQLSAQMLLDIAADRLRSFFVLAYFGQSTDEYKSADQGKAGPEMQNCGMKPHYYQAPFAHAVAIDESARLNQLRELKTLTARLFGYREARNKVVHEVALDQLRAGKKGDGRNSLGEFEGAGPATPDATGSPLEGLPPAVQEGLITYQAKLQSAADDVVDWYRTLVEAIDIVFDIEHSLR